VLRRGESRWLFFLHDYLGCVFGATFSTFIMMAGFLGASEFADDSGVRDIAYLCAGLSGFAFVFNLLLSLLWARHFVRVLRQAKAD